MLKWTSLDGSGVEWLRDHPNTYVRLELAWLDYLRSRFDLRVARPLGRTKFGRHIEEYREHREDRALHVRQFADHLVIHTDWWNPDWSWAAFFRHLVRDTPVPHIGLAIGLAGLALYLALG